MLIGIIVGIIGGVIGFVIGHIIGVKKISGKELVHNAELAHAYLTVWAYRLTMGLAGLLIGTILSGYIDSSTISYIPIKKDKILVERSSEKCLGKITIKDSYKIKGTQYFVIKTTLTEDTSYTFTEKEYDQLFGKGSDAFETEVYTVKLYADLGTHKSLKKPKDTQYTIGLWTRPSTDNNYRCKYPYFDDSNLSDAYIYVTENRRSSFFYPKSDVYAEINCKRLSVFGESDFTDDEIEKYKQYIVEMDKTFFSSTNK